MAKMMGIALHRTPDRFGEKLALSKLFFVASLPTQFSPFLVVLFMGVKRLSLGLFWYNLVWHACNVIFELKYSWKLLIVCTLFICDLRFTLTYLQEERHRYWTFWYLETFSPTKVDAVDRSLAIVFVELRYCPTKARLISREILDYYSHTPSLFAPTKFRSHFQQQCKLVTIITVLSFQNWNPAWLGNKMIRVPIVWARDDSAHKTPFTSSPRAKLRDVSVMYHGKINRK